ncbi:MAG: multidrug ABC transporter [uncultured bacterium]|nr:MAG: multidrug ABC transporter [uncultured bacterium]
MNKKKIVSILVVVTIVIAGFYRYYHHNILPDDNGIWVQAAKVQETTVQQEAHAIGTLVGRSIEVTPEISGHIKEVLFQDGVAVKQGDVLFQLNDTIYKAKAESAKAKFQYSINNHKRMAFLGKKGVVAKQAVDQAEADLKEKQADAEESNVMLSNTKLVAPFDGMVGKSKVNPGDYVTIGQNLVTLTDTKHLRVEYNVTEKMLSKLKMGQEVHITTTAYPGKIFIGKVSFISPTINIDNRSVSLYADVSNANNQLAAGMFVDVMQSLDNQGKALTIPARSLVPMLDGEQVYKVVDGKAYAVTVTVGDRSEEYVQITRGLSVGDVVITDGQLKLKNGVPVKVKA